MRPLPRLLAMADDRIAIMDDLGIRAAAIAAVGPSAALVARRPAGTVEELSALAERFMSLTRPPMAALLVTGRADVALAVGTQGVILRSQDLAVDEAREVVGGRAWCVRSVHSEREAEAAAAAGADALLVGSIWPTATHPGQNPLGLPPLAHIARLGVPSFAIGGVTAERAQEARDAGAWGVAAIRSLWDADDPYRAALALLAPWSEGKESNAAEDQR